MSVSSVGIDLGSSKCVIVADDADVVLTDTGSISRPMLVSFVGRSRLVGEEAAVQANAESMIRHLNLLLEQDSIETLQKSPLSTHRAAKLDTDAGNRIVATITYNDDCMDVSVTSLLGMFLAHQDRRICSVYPAEGGKAKPGLSFVLPPTATAVAATTIRQACCIAGIDLSRVSTVNKAECLNIAYTRKVHGLTPAERSLLENKSVVVIEMGHTQTTAILLKVGSLDPKTTPLFSAAGPTVINTAYDAELGALHFDIEIFKHFASICKAKHQVDVAPGSKRGKRLLAGCERVRKLLSQLPESSLTVENLTDSGDVNFSLKREDLNKFGSALLDRFRALLKDVLLKGLSEKEINDIAAVEVLGGGVRMQIVQSIICEVFRSNNNINNTIGSPITDNSQKMLGAKLDDGSVALGAALVASHQRAQLTAESKMPAQGDGNNYNTDPAVFSPVGAFATAGTAAADGVTGFTADEIVALIAQEQKMQEQDRSIEQLLACRNDMEAYILYCRGFKRHKFGGAEYIDGKALDLLIDDNENWMYDEADASLEEVTKRFASLKTAVETQLCPKYFAAVAAEKQAMEATMAAEAEAAAAEKAANGEDDEDNDNRRLKKADRMRMVMKNKAEGTEVFNGGVYKTAAARYQKALTHASKFFDLTPADEEEVKQVKISLYLNVAMCYLKMEKPDFVINNCNFALELDSRNVKALFRRSSAWEAKKEWQNALKDAKAAQTESVVPDKAINATVVRLGKVIAAAKEGEKKMWSKGFGK